MAENQISIAQYFEQTNERLERIERSSLAQKSVLNFEEFCIYTGLSSSFAYKLTSARAIEYSQPNGKKIYFNRQVVDAYLLSNPVKTKNQLAKEVLGGRGK